MKTQASAPFLAAVSLGDTLLSDSTTIWIANKKQNCSGPHPLPWLVSLQHSSALL